MKSLALLAVIFGSTVAMAQQQKAPIQMIDEPIVEYVSWCEDNKVVYENEKGEILVQADCNQYQSKCTMIQKSRFHLTQYFAYCAK